MKTNTMHSVILINNGGVNLRYALQCADVLEQRTDSAHMEKAKYAFLLSLLLFTDELFHAFCPFTCSSKTRLFENLNIVTIGQNSS